MFKNLREKVTDWLDDHGEIVFYGSYALSVGMVIGALLQNKKISRDLTNLCRTGASYHVDVPRKGVRYLYQFGQESLNN